MTEIGHEHLEFVRVRAHRLKSIVGFLADFDDLYSDGIEGFYRGFQAWERDGQPCELEAWCTPYVRRAMVDGLRKRHGHKFRQMAESLDAPLVDGMTVADTVQDPRADVVSIVEARERLVAKTLGRGWEFCDLGAREREVLERAAGGDSIEETARKMGTTTATVKEQRKKVIRKLGARNMPNAVFLYLTRKVA